MLQAWKKWERPGDEARLEWHQNGQQIEGVFLDIQLARLRRLNDGRPARVQHGKDSAHPQQEGRHHKSPNSARDRRLYRWVRMLLIFSVIL